MTILDDAETVYAITAPEYPLSPHHTKLYPENSYGINNYNSNVIDKVKNSTHNEIEIIDGVMHQTFGPVFLISIPIRKFYSPFTDSWPLSMICCDSEYDIKIIKGVTHPDNVLINELDLVDQSCHPTSFVIPVNSPLLNLMCRISYLDKVNDYSAIFGKEHLLWNLPHERTLKKLFPNYQFKKIKDNLVLHYINKGRFPRMLSPSIKKFMPKNALNQFAKYKNKFKKHNNICCVCFNPFPSNKLLHARCGCQHCLICAQINMCTKCNEPICSCDTYLCYGCGKNVYRMYVTVSS